ncbi:hypothetical protein BJ508DRAFT_413199 [Ascobolus immersus RN42]|uniref:Uncharacterized protein n=1 Tax=Ascobolus immersus RN42 TaxID=1160509 RepID=A0A3N4IEI0_ASCIM|nr:hypothetical protein BJ508DRAFT_413199 [Ascobolus immersus RN42]
MSVHVEGMRRSKRLRLVNTRKADNHARVESKQISQHNSIPSPLQTIPNEIIMLLGNHIPNWNDYQNLRHSCRRTSQCLSRNHARKSFAFGKRIEKHMHGLAHFCLTRLRSGTDSDCSEYLRRLLDAAGIRLIEPTKGSVALEPSEVDWLEFCWRQNILHGALSTLADSESIFSCDLEYDHRGYYDKLVDEVYDRTWPAPPDGFDEDDWMGMVEEYSNDNEASFLNRSFNMRCEFQEAYQSLDSRSTSQNLERLHQEVFVKLGIELFEKFFNEVEKNEMQFPGWLEKLGEAVYLEDPPVTESVSVSLMLEVKRLERIFDDVETLLRYGFSTVLVLWRDPDYRVACPFGTGSDNWFATSGRCSFS